MHFKNLLILVNWLVLTENFVIYANSLESNPNKSFLNWFDQLNKELSVINQYGAHFEWESSTNAEQSVADDAAKFNAYKSKWVLRKCDEATGLLSLTFTSHSKMHFILNTALLDAVRKILCSSPRLTEYQTTELTKSLFAMQEIYTSTRVCLPVYFDICQNLDHIWNFTYVQDSTGHIHRLDLRVVRPRSIHRCSKLKIFNANTTNGHQKVTGLKQLAIEEKIHTGPMMCFNGEPDLERIMKGDFSVFQRNDCALRLNEVFRWAWESWRLAVGPSIHEIYPKAVQIMNIGARNNGYHDIGNFWQYEIDLPDLGSKMTDLINQIHPFYELLHGVLRNALWKRVNKFETFQKHKTIPAHLLGSMWSQNWELYHNLILPFSEVDLEANLKKQNWTKIDMVKRAEDFYVSLGLPAMTKSFWRNSNFERNSHVSKCHGSAANMFNGSDYRMIVCSASNLDDFYVIVHEMGHLHCYMAFKEQPIIFQDANAVLQESIGDAIFLGIMAPQHLNRLDLLPDKFLYANKLPKLSQSYLKMVHSYKNDTEINQDMWKDEMNSKQWEKLQILGRIFPQISRINERRTKFEEYKSSIDQSINGFDISFLLRMALKKIPQIPFQYILDIFRWNIFNGSVPMSRANAYFWSLSLQYQGIHPPDWINREKFFDPGAKFHVADNTPYVRYYLASFVQAQIFRGLCQMTIFGYVQPIEVLPMPLHRCDIYGSKRAGKLLKAALKLGNSQHWTEALYILTGSREISADALLLYYQPLIIWLEKLTNDFDIPSGWL